MLHKVTEICEDGFFGHINVLPTNRSITMCSEITIIKGQ